MKACLKEARCYDSQVALQRARNLYGTEPRYIPATPAPITNVRTQSDLLAYEMMSTAKVCPPIVNKLPTRESSRMRDVVQKVLDCEVDPTNPTSRFVHYERFFPVPCAPVSAEYLNASMPKASTACPLPNQPNFPVFPS
jgi:hypothetical protein